MSLTPHSANFITAWAPAKVNLYLHVGPPGPGGFHPLDSLVVFADTRAADRISARPSHHLNLRVEGPGASRLRNADNNLARTAGLVLRDACERGSLGASLVLYKELPIAGGVGGGSSDAAAALHILNEMWGIDFGEAALEGLAIQLGSDVPACVRLRPLVMRGAGERLSDAVTPDLPAVLVNPGTALETRKVFERFDQLGANREFRETAPPSGRDLTTFVRSLADFRNDLQPAALVLNAEVRRVLDAIQAEPGCLLARMSGSGPTCFGIFCDDAAAEAAARSIANRKRRYWVRATTLRGSAAGSVNQTADSASS